SRFGSGGGTRSVARLRALRGFGRYLLRSGHNLGECAPVCCGGADNLWNFVAGTPPPSCSSWGGRLNYSYRIKRSDVAVKEGGELGLRQRADTGRLDVAVLEEHQGRDAPDTELRRHVLVLVDVD